MTTDLQGARHRERRTASMPHKKNSSHKRVLAFNPEPNWESHAWMVSLLHQLQKLMGKGGTKTGEQPPAHKEQWGKLLYPGTSGQLLKERSLFTQHSAWKLGSVVDSQVALSQKAEWHQLCISVSWGPLERAGAVGISFFRRECST